MGHTYRPDYGATVPSNIVSLYYFSPSYLDPSNQLSTVCISSMQTPDYSLAYDHNLPLH